MNLDPKDFENKIGLDFRDKGLMVTALSHSSYTNELGLPHFMCNERLEFLGDAVLEIVSSEILFKKYKTKNEGELSKIRANLVCESSLAKCAKLIGLEAYIQLGKGEEKTGGRGRDSVISDCMEALIGAIYLDRGMKSAKDFIKKYILFDIEKMGFFADNKTALQILLQAKGSIPKYTLIAEEGPPHNKSFTVEVRNGETVLGRGEGHSKKTAEQQAAKEALNILQGKE